MPWELAARGELHLTEGSGGLIGVISSQQFVGYNPQVERRGACLADSADWTLLGQVVLDNW